MRLYHFPGTRSTRVLWAAKELGAELDLVQVNLMAGEQRQPAFKALHPHGQVPVLEDQAAGVTLVESGAIALWVVESLDKDEILTPPRGSTERARFWEWMFYTTATLDGVIVPAVLHTSFLPAEYRKPEIAASHITTWREVAAPFVTSRLGSNTWACGDRFSLADVFLGYDLVLANMIGALDGNESLQAYLGRLSARDGFKAAFPG